MPTQLRGGRASDADAAVTVWQLAHTARRGGVPVPAEHERRVRGYLAKDDCFLAVAEDDTQLVAMALGMQALADDGVGPPLPGVCHVSIVFVHPDHWGRGIGKLLMRRLLVEGRQRGYDAFQLWTHADNDRAQHLYEGLGFHRSGREKYDDLGELVVHYVLPPRAAR